MLSAELQVSIALLLHLLHRSLTKSSCEEAIAPLHLPQLVDMNTLSGEMICKGDQVKGFQSIFSALCFIEI